MRFVPDYALSDASLASPRFIIVCDNGQDGQGATGNGMLLFVTFDASLLRHSGTDAAGETLLQVAGLDRPFTYEELSQHLGLLERHKHLDGAPAFIKKVLEYIFRDINDGGCSSNWELMSYVYVDPTHFTRCSRTTVRPWPPSSRTRSRGRCSSCATRSKARRATERYR